ADLGPAPRVERLPVRIRGLGEEAPVELPEQLQLAVDASGAALEGAVARGRGRQRAQAQQKREAEQTVGSVLSEASHEKFVTVRIRLILRGDVPANVSNCRPTVRLCNPQSDIGRRSARCLTCSAKEPTRIPASPLRARTHPSWRSPLWLPPWASRAPRQRA